MFKIKLKLTTFPLLLCSFILHAQVPEYKRPTSVAEFTKQFDQQIKEGREDLKKIMDEDIKRDPTLRKKSLEKLKEYDEQMKLLREEQIEKMSGLFKFSEDVQRKLDNRDPTPVDTTALIPFTESVEGFIYALASSQEKYHSNNNTYFSCENEACENFAKRSRENINHDFKVFGDSKSYQIWARDRRYPEKVYHLSTETVAIFRKDANSWPE